MVIFVESLRDELTVTYGAHQRIQHADREGRPAGERLGEVQLGVGVVIVVLVQELNVGVVHCVSQNVSSVHLLSFSFSPLVRSGMRQNRIHRFVFLPFLPFPLDGRQTPLPDKIRPLLS